MLNISFSKEEEAKFVIEVVKSIASEGVGGISPVFAGIKVDTVLISEALEMIHNEQQVKEGLGRVFEQLLAFSQNYLFPIIQRTGNSEDMRKDIKNNLKNYNKQLKKIAEMAGIEHNLTSYVSRHSWATIASANGVPINVISKGLKHNDIKTTQIYLADCGNEEVDDANANIIQ